MDLSTVAVPRHVHKRGGRSQIVWTADELATALAEGWGLDPNALPPEPEPEPEPDADLEPEPATEDTPARKRGRPRKGA